MKITILLFLIFGICINAHASSKLIYNSSEKIKITIEQKKRLENYLSDNFYSYSQQHQSNGHYGAMIFALSEDGSVSSILACSSIITIDCREGVNPYQIVQKAKKSSNNNDVKILFKEKQFVANKNKINLSSVYTDGFKKDVFEIIFKENFQIIESKNNIFLDRVIFETHSPSDDDFQ